MVTMDLKGITWVGHVYQKFEAMCLEVEEVMYQDTVKYVENQVQTVGASVKKFYSDVIQDILPPSSMDLVKGTATPKLSAEQYTDVGIYKRYKVGFKEEAVEVDHEQYDGSQGSVYLDKDGGHGPASIAQGSVYLDKDGGHEPSFHGFDIDDISFQPSSRRTVKGVCSDFYSKQYDNRMHSKSSLGVEKISKEENFSSSERLGAVAHTEKDGRGALLFSEPSVKNQEALCDQSDKSPTPDKIGVCGCNCSEAICDEFENASKGTPGGFTDGPDCNEIDNATAHSSCNDVSAEVNAADTCKNNGAVSLVGCSSVNRDLEPSECPDEIILVCHPGLADDSTDTIECNIAVAQELETVQKVDNIQVEENCVLVNGDDLHFVPQQERRHRPYKKKIRDVISSKMRSGRKQEYEQLAVRYGEGVNSYQESAECSTHNILMRDMKRSPSQNPNELDWELL